MIEFDEEPTVMEIRDPDSGEIVTQRYGAVEKQCSLMIYPGALRYGGPKCLVFSLDDMDELIRHGVPPSQLVLDGEVQEPTAEVRMSVYD